MRDAHLRRLREDGCTLSEMARELRTSQEIIRRQVVEQEAEEREMEPMVSGPPARIHKGWLEMEGEA
jgi:ribosomal protein S6